MAKHIPKEYFLTPSNEYLEKFDQFIYEMIVFHLYKDKRCEMVNSKFIKSKHKLLIKKSSVYEYKDGYIILKCIDLIGVPERYIIDNNLKSVMK